MARITADDCLTQIPNRYQLVLAASKRARQLANGFKDPLIENEGDNKPNVIALREIAEGLITPEKLTNIEQDLENQSVEVSMDEMMEKFSALDKKRKEERLRQEELQQDLLARSQKRKELKAQKMMETQLLAENADLNDISEEDDFYINEDEEPPIEQD